MDGPRLAPVMEEAGEPTDDHSSDKTAKPEMKELTAAEKEVEEIKANSEKDEKPASDNQELEDLKSQVLQLLVELEEARELSQKHEESFQELQGLLEDERMASAQQAESFTKQIQRLQAQLRSVQEEMDSLEEEKNSELAEAQQELRTAQEEVLVLQQAAEEAAAERENDIASLQEELCRLRAELQRLHATRQEYELEITSLRAEIRMKSQGSGQNKDNGNPLQAEQQTVKEECQSLKAECQSLKEENQQLLEKIQWLTEQGTNDFYLTLKEDDLNNEGEFISSGEESTTRCKLVDASVQKNISFDGKPLTPTGRSGGGFSPAFSEVFSLRDQLKQTEEKALQVQREYETLLAELHELQDKYNKSQNERSEMEKELQECREQMQSLTGKDGKGLEGGWSPLMVVAVATAVVLIFPSLTRALS
ncbi:coiled-coil domain-containing protein 136 isoform X2 [Polypterus senegalus]|uniref:coiled-coil domain-containing protein 136 isoform X2 n=1 Tax=Polypterus senegalus TaxID=55291 RepID=UPI001962C9F8|nr:coiled-coil domain-containing protein 136 isoform X2 [Polypterus senegalus]